MCYLHYLLTDLHEIMVLSRCSHVMRLSLMFADIETSLTALSR